MGNLAVSDNVGSINPVAYVPLGMHLVGSVPLPSAEDVFRTMSAAVGDRLRRMADGETGARADWIVWQYPVLSSRPQFEVAPPTPDFYKALPRLKLREGEAGQGVEFGSLGYAEAAQGSYRTFRQLKREGIIPARCRFQVSLPTPLAPIAAFVAASDQVEMEQVYERAMAAEVEAILDAIPREQLAIQWDANFEFAMLENEMRAWFPDVKAGILERLIRLSRLVPSDVELGFHFCYGDGSERRPAPPDMRQLVEIANAVSASLGRSIDWIHMPAQAATEDQEAMFFAPLRELRLQPDTQLFLGVLCHGDEEAATRARIAALSELVGEFGVATSCGWGRLATTHVDALLETHSRHSRALAGAGDVRPAFDWPAGVSRIPDEEWTQAPLDTFGLRYDSVDAHGWYRNLDPTVTQLARDLQDGDLLIDFSGGTGILLNRLLMRIFDRPVGVLIVDASQKFLRVAVEHFREDPRVGVRLLRYLREQNRLEFMDEVLGPALLERQADAIVSTNAVHLYTNLDETLASWARVVRPGGRLYINSGNLRNPDAAANEWILDETVYVVHEVATGIARTKPRYQAYRDVLHDAERLQKYLDFRDRVFAPPRPLELYTSALHEAGFDVVGVTHETIAADVDDWFDLLTAYHEPVLGWVGGTEKVDGVAPSEEAVADRLALIRDSLDAIFGHRPGFKCCWTYIEGRRREDS